VTNRDYILKTAPYDLLVKLNEKIYDNTGYVSPYLCFIEMVKEEHIMVKVKYTRANGEEEYREVYCKDTKPDCDKCIQRWLNEERR
jgi:hypothetical protein